MKIWDLATRLYHWLQAMLFVGLMGSGLSGNGPHTQLGLAMFTLLVWRLLWGWVGSDTSRFRQFLRSPQEVAAYLKRSNDKVSLGHNPLGGWMVVAMLTVLMLQCVSGMIMAGFGKSWPLLSNEVVVMFTESIHLGLVNVLPILVAVHVVAIVIYKLRGKPLLKAMFTGQQPAVNGETLYFASHLRAIGVLVLALSVTIALIVVR